MVNATEEFDLLEPERGGDRPGHVRLGCAVILRAVLDGGTASAQHLRLPARAWVVASNPAFASWAVTAGFDPDWLARVINEHWQRRDAGRAGRREARRSARPTASGSSQEAA